MRGTTHPFGIKLLIIPNGCVFHPGTLMPANRGAIDAYVHQVTPAQRRAVPLTELMALFRDLPPMSAEAFRADLDRYAEVL